MAGEGWGVSQRAQPWERLHIALVLFQRWRWEGADVIHEHVPVDVSDLRIARLKASGSNLCLLDYRLRLHPSAKSLQHYSGRHEGSFRLSVASGLSAGS